MHHVFPSSNCPLHEHVLSFLRVRLLLFRGRVVLCPSGWPPSDLSERIVHIAREVLISINFNGMQLVGASYVPKLKLPRPRASRVPWGQVDALTHDLCRKDPVLASVLTGARGV